MKTLCLLLLLSTPAAAQDAPLERFSVPNFNAGVVSRYSPILIPDNAVQDARNVYFDEYGVTRRKGYSKFNATALTDTKSVRGLWSFTADDGSRYLVALSSETIFAAPTSGIFTAITGLSGLSSASDMDAVAYLGKIWFANGVDAMSYWTGSSTATVTEAPLGNLVEGWRNRIVNAGVPGSLSYVYMSEGLDGTEWTLGPTLSESPVAIAVGGTNAKPIKCLYAGFKDFLFIGNEDEVYGVYGFGRNDFVLRTISKEVGCIEDKSVQEKDGALYWMSRRGIEKMTTQGGIDRISDGVRDVFDTLIENTALVRLKLYSSQSDWEEGNLSAGGDGAKMSATISPGNVVPSTWSITETDGSSWDLGTKTQVSTSIYSGSLSLAYSGAATLLDAFSDGDYTSNPTWTCSGTCSVTTSGLRWGNKNIGTLSTPVVYNHYGSWRFVSVGIHGTLKAYFLSDSSNPADSNGYMLKLYTDGLGNPTVVTLYKVTAGSESSLGSGTGGNWNSSNTYYIDRSETGGMTVKLNGTTIFSSTDTTHTGVNAYFIAYGDSDGTSSIDVTIDDIYRPANFYTTGSYLSQIYDTTFSTTIGGPFYFSNTVPAGSAISYSVRGSTYNSVAGMSAWGAVSGVSGAYRVPLTQRYWQYKADFSTSYSTQTPTIQDVTLAAATAGEYIHKCAPTTAITSWGLFQANTVIDDGYSDTLPSIKFYVSTGPTCDSVERTTAAWTLQNNNAPITLSTAAYIGVKEIFTIDSSTQTAALLDVTINWLEGAARPPVASAIYLDRYYLSYTTSSSAGINDFMYVADKNDAPTFLENMNCYSLSLFNRRMYCGDANATGKVYQMEVGQDDDGKSFTSYVRTKAYHFGDPDAEKEFVKLYADFAPASNTLLDIDVSASYRLDLSTTAISLGDINTGEDATAGMLVSKIPFPLENNLTGRFMDVRFTNNGKEGNWTLYGLSIYFRRYDVK